MPVPGTVVVVAVVVCGGGGADTEAVGGVPGAHEVVHLVWVGGVGVCGGVCRDERAVASLDRCVVYGVAGSGCGSGRDG